MTNFNLPYFGQINLTELEEYYNTVAELDGGKVRLDINFQNKTIALSGADIIKGFLQNIDRFDKQNKLYIENDFKDKGETTDYINFYLEELDEDELLSIIGSSEEQIEKEIQLINKLKLIRVGLYPDGKYGGNHFGIFDYSIDIDGEPCNQLLVVLTNDQGNLDDITWES